MAKEYKETIKYRFNDQEITFETERNHLNGQQMWWFSNIPQMFAGTVADAKSVARDIRNTMELIQ